MRKSNFAKMGAGDKLNAEQKEEFKAAFNNFADESGNIHNEKLKEIFKNLGQELNDDEITTMVMEVDEDGSGEIDIDEFYGMMADLLGLVEPEDNKDAFNCMQSQPGYISCADMKEVEKPQSMTSAKSSCSKLQGADHRPASDHR